MIDPYAALDQIQLDWVSVKDMLPPVHELQFEPTYVSWKQLGLEELTFEVSGHDSILDSSTTKKFNTGFAVIVRLEETLSQTWRYCNIISSLVGINNEDICTRHAGSLSNGNP